MDAVFRVKPCVSFEVQKIIGVSCDGNVRNYQVQWAPSWVSDAQLLGCEPLIEQFLHCQSTQEENLLYERSCSRSQEPLSKAIKSGTVDSQPILNTAVSSDLSSGGDHVDVLHATSSCDTDFSTSSNDFSSTPVISDVVTTQEYETSQNVMFSVKKEVETCGEQIEDLAAESSSASLIQSDSIETRVGSADNINNNIMGEMYLNNKAEIRVDSTDNVNNSMCKMSEIYQNNHNSLNNYVGKGRDIKQKNVNPYDYRVSDVHSTGHSSSYLEQRNCNLSFSEEAHGDYNLSMETNSLENIYNTKNESIRDKKEIIILDEDDPEREQYNSYIHQNEYNVNLPQHLQQHRCNICGKTFKHRSNMQRHILTQHNGHNFARYICSVCGKKCFSKWYLLRHMTSHSKVKPFNCTECGKTFKSNRSMLRHMGSHENVLPQRDGSSEF